MNKKVIAIMLAILISISLFFSIFFYLVVALLNKKFTVHEGLVVTSPTVAQRSVYFGGADGSIYALDATNGKQKWRKKIAPPSKSPDYKNALFIAPIVDSKRIYMPDNNRWLYALGIKNGDTEWKIKLPYAINSMTYNQGVIYLHQGWNVYAINARTGKTKWRAKTDDSDDYSLEGLIINKGVLYGSTYDGNIYAFSTTDGEREWKTSLKGKKISFPATDGQLLYLISEDGYLTALDKNNGKKVWQKRDYNVCLETMASKGLVFYHSHNDNFYAINGKNGKEIWRYPVDDAMGYAVKDGALYFGTYGLYKLNAKSGKKLWAFKSKDYLDLKAAVTKETVFAAGIGTVLYAIDVNTGKQIWKSSGGKKQSSVIQVIGKIISDGRE